MSEEIQAATSAEVIATEQDAIPVEQDSTEATTGQTQEATLEQKDEAEKKTPWFQKRISEVTREKYEAKRQAEDSAAQVQHLTEQLARFHSGDTSGDIDVQAMARQEANRIVAERSFDEKCNKVYADGMKDFPDFNEAVRNLQMVGVNKQFLELATDSDAGAKLLHHLAQDLDEASRIAALSPVQMARELTRLEMKLSTPTAKPVSKAPEPINPIGRGKVSEAGLSDDIPIEEWMRRRNKERFGR